MRLVVITKRYNSSVANQRVMPTPLDGEGKPMYLICVSDERAQELIDAEVAEEYVTDESILTVPSIDPNKGTADDSHEDDSDNDDSDDSDANNNDDSNDDDSSEKESEEEKETEKKTNSKKNK